MIYTPGSEYAYFQIRVLNSSDSIIHASELFDDPGIFEDIYTINISDLGFKINNNSISLHVKLFYFYKDLNFESYEYLDSKEIQIHEAILAEDDNPSNGDDDSDDDSSKDVKNSNIIDLNTISGIPLIYILIDLSLSCGILLTRFYKRSSQAFIKHSNASKC